MTSPALHPSLGQDIAAWHDEALQAVGEPPIAQPPAAEDGSDPLWAAVRNNHYYNSRLWHEEDLARRTQVGDAEIAANKRVIDRCNQARNDATEQIDEWLLLSLGLVDAASARSDAPVSLAPPGARLNSETAGSMIDRMSILALKINAMRHQADRADAEPAHREAAAQRLSRLLEQRADLCRCLDALLHDCVQGRAYFKVYRQFKMYNDPRWNPALVAEQASQRAA